MVTILDNMVTILDNMVTIYDNMVTILDNIATILDNDTLRFPFLADRLQTMQHLISNRSPKQNFAKSGKIFQKNSYGEGLSASGKKLLTHPDHLLGTSFFSIILLDPTRFHVVSKQ